jgi:hypothetical protein
MMKSVTNLPSHGEGWVNFGFGGGKMVKAISAR